MSRKIKFVSGEYYHVYNRGIDKRDIFGDKEDLNRYFKYLKVLNTEDPIGSLYEHSFLEEKHQLGGLASKLVEIVCFCLNPNHYHLLLRQVKDNGVSNFMHRLGTAHTMYFNEKYSRSGSLFQGTFKAVHVDNNEYLLHLSAYINQNFKVHDKQVTEDGDQLTLSSWNEYKNNNEGLCSKRIILDQFQGLDDYRSFVNSSLEFSREVKRNKGDFSQYLLE